MKSINKISFLVISIFSLYTLRVNAQDFKVIGYADAYYAYDNDNSGSSLRQFSAVAPIRDQFRINLAQVTGTYSAEKVRGVVTLQFGDIPYYNWPQSPNQYLQYIQEANVGFQPIKNLWFDMGYFLTHIGAEGIIPINNNFSSLSLATYYEPFYQSGIRVNYTFSDKAYGSLYLLNGYNVFADNNKNLSGAMQVGFKPQKNIELIYNNIVGNEQPSGNKGKTRFFNNLVLKYSPFEKLDLLLGVDYAIQQDSKLSDSLSAADLYGGLFSVKYKFASKFSAMLRLETFGDKNGILSGTYMNTDSVLTGLKAGGISIGIEHKPVDNGYLRIETRYLKTNEDLKIFNINKSSRDFRTEFILSSGITF